MTQKNPDSCLNQNQSCFYSFQNGYFGKPTKLRGSQPSMFQILNWNVQSPQQLNVNQTQAKKCMNCGCQYSKNNEYIQQNSKLGGGNPRTNQVLSKKINDEQIGRKQSPKGKELLHSYHQLKSQKDYQIIDKNEHSKQQKVQIAEKRPKSAGNPLKKVKQVEHEQKSPRFTNNLNKVEATIQQQAPQTKEKLIQKFKQTTRWIPNSSFTTYFGKPAFQNYGRGNTKPTYGGLMYGNYLKTHNIQPHRGVNSPKNIQSYNVALLKGQQIGTIYPYPPKIHKNQQLVSQAQKSPSGELQSTQIYAENNCFRSFPIQAPNLYQLQKFGGKGIQKINKSRLQRSNVTGKQNNNNNQEYQPEVMRRKGTTQKGYAY